MNELFLTVIAMSIIAMVVVSLLAAVGWAGIGLYMIWSLVMVWLGNLRRRKKRG
jgi:hypothetical protein